MQEEEVWKPVVGWEDRYEVSNLGRVRSKTIEIPARNGFIYKKRGKILSACANSQGRLTVNLMRNRKGKTYKVHVLVICAHVGPKPDDCPIFGPYECSHIDGDKLNNAASNLKWVTHHENEQHKKLHGTNNYHLVFDERGKFKEIAGLRIFTSERILDAGCESTRSARKTFCACCRRRDDDNCI